MLNFKADTTKVLHFVLKQKKFSIEMNHLLSFHSTRGLGFICLVVFWFSIFSPKLPSYRDRRNIAPSNSFGMYDYTWFISSIEKVMQSKAEIIPNPWFQISPCQCLHVEQGRKMWSPEAAFCASFDVYPGSRRCIPKHNQRAEGETQKFYCPLVNIFFHFLQNAYSRTQVLWQRARHNILGWEQGTLILPTTK